MAPVVKEQENGGREESNEEINKGEKDEITTVSTTALSESGEGLGTDVFLSFDFPATEKQGISYKKNTDDSFLLSSFLLPFLDQHDTSRECWLTIELLHFIRFGLKKWNLVGWYSSSCAMQYLATAIEDWVNKYWSPITVDP